MPWALPGDAEGAVRPAVRARGHLSGEGLPGIHFGDGPAALARHVAATDVEGDGRGVSVEAALDEPVGRRWPALAALFDFGCPLLGRGDGLVEALHP